MEYVIFIVILFPFIFVGMWALVTYIVSKMGWASLAKKFKVERSFNGTRIGIITAWVNLGSYKNTIILKHNEKGIYLETIILFRLFHPAVFIPWTEIKEVRKKKFFFTQYSELIVGNPSVATIRLRTKTFNKLEPEYNRAKKLYSNS